MTDAEAAPTRGDPRTVAVREEQAHLDRAWARLEELRELADRRRREALAAPVTTHADLVDRDALAHGAAVRLAALSVGDGEPLIFGRIDPTSGDELHVGRLSLLTANYDPLVVDWRSDAAAAFYRATPADPHGLRRRRVIHSRGRRVLDVEDHLLDLDAAPPDERLVGDASLMAALTRDRSDRMRDIVATIQREQDEIIRLPASGVVVVTGGPGTGKTAVALHRVAYVLYRHRGHLERRGVLIVGPTREFTDYVQGVLPSLGESAAVLRPVGAFLGGLAADRHDPRDLARVKGDAAMVRVARRLAARLRPGADWRAALRRFRDEVRELTRDALAAADAELLTAGLADDAAAGRAPSVEDVALLDEVLHHVGRRDPLDDAPRRVEDDGGVTTFADREAPLRLERVLTDPGYRGFGHVVVDEAQDLSVMQWRMVARRGPAASWTVVGDLAQRGAPSAPRDWRAVVDLLPRRSLTVGELTVNYRTPGPVMALAARLLPVVAPDQRPPRSARADGHEPTLLLDARPVTDHAEKAARELRTAVTGTVAVIAPQRTAETLRGRLADADVRVHTAWTAKGLEFDGVVVVDPAALADAHGWSAVYVACTRATRRLTLVAPEPELPPPLREARDDDERAASAG